jgi:hypothetical protein
MSARHGGRAPFTAIPLHPRIGRGRLPLLWSLIVGLQTGMGCAGLAPRPSTDGEPAGVVLFVTNRTFVDQRVYLLTEATPVLLGDVPPLSSRLMVIQRIRVSSVGEHRLIARTRGGQADYVSQSFILSNGDSIFWTIDSFQAPFAYVKAGRNPYW